MRMPERRFGVSSFAFVLRVRRGPGQGEVVRAWGRGPSCLREMVVLTVLLIMSGAAPAFATTIALQSIDQMTARSDVIVRAEPVPDSAVSMWDKDHRMIMTHTTFQVVEALHGDVKAAQEIVVETFGGFVEADQIGFAIPGSPVFRPDEEVVLFLERSAYTQMLQTLDLAAGKFEVLRKDGKEVITRRDLGDALVFDAKVKIPETLPELRGAIRVAAAKKAAAEKKRKQENNAQEGGNVSDKN